MGVFNTGEIVRFDIIDKKVTPDGYSSGVYERCQEDELILFQKIYVTNYPSWNDFSGASSKIKHGAYGLVIRSLGVPWKLSNLENKDIYEVYEVLTPKISKRCVFVFNLTKAFSSS